MTAAATLATTATVAVQTPLPFAAASSLFAGHEIVLPVVLPLLAGALILLLEAARSRWVSAFSFTATLAGALLAAALVAQAHQGQVQVYLVGNWQAPWGIALVLDRLAALMLALTAAVALAALAYALGSERAASRALQGAASSPPAAALPVSANSHFHSLFQFQLMGLNGAFLTGDLFNLFVFFEVLLAASYGLLLHDATRARLRAGLHYVVFNLAGSALFLVALSLLYSLAGTLNMADLAAKLPQLPPGDQRLAQAAALLLLVVFAVKAALLPLYFWLPQTYASAAAPVAALFAIMTKVGVYAIARCTTLVFGTGALASVAQPALPALALATLVLAAQGALAATRLRTLAAYLVVASAGTLLLAVGLQSTAALSAGLFYLVNSTLAAALWFLLADRVAALRAGSDRLQAAPLPAPGAWVPLAIGFFFAALAAVGLPPLSGFFGKSMVLVAAGQTPWAAWAVALVLGSSLALMVALARAGSTLFWKPAATGSAAAASMPASGAMSSGPPFASAWPLGQRLAVTGLCAAIVAATLGAGPLAAYAEATARQLRAPGPYVAAVLDASPAPAAHDVRREMRERGEPK